MKKIFTLISFLSASTGALLAQCLPNPGFETWVSSGFPASISPTSWNTANPSTAIIGVTTCVQTTAAADKHSGSYAVRLITESFTLLGKAQLVPGIATTGTINSTTYQIQGGIATTQRPDSIIGWYKYNSFGGEAGFIALDLFGAAANNTDTVAKASFTTPAATSTTWKRFSAPVVYTTSPNPVANSIWLLSSSPYDSSATSVGCSLYVDDLGLVFNPASGIAEQNNPNELTVYPNPSSGLFNLKMNQPENLKIKIYNVYGECIHQQISKSAYLQVDLNSPDGLYLYSVMDESNTTIKIGKLIIQK